MKLRITIEGRAYEAEVEILDSEENAPEYPAYPAPPAFVPASMSEVTAPQQPPELAPHSENEFRSPVTGMVIEVHVIPGQPVEPEEVLVVLESMKMEMQVTTPRAGVVHRVLVAPGATVKVNQLLVEFE